MTVKTALAKLEEVDLREIWPDEARDFTPWLASEEGLKLLSEAVGADLRFAQREAPVGPYSCDLVCTLAGGDEEHKVVIENQLETTNHDHLGKLITYAAGEDAKTLIWISKEFSEEHRQALLWLNENVIEGKAFFALEIHAYRIGGSAPAPHFLVISKPNEWTKRIRGTTPRTTKEELLALAKERKIAGLVQILQALSEFADEQPSGAYGKSFRYWRKNPDAFAKMVCGINVSGDRRGTPVGQVDLWVRTKELAEVTELEPSDIQNRLRASKLPITEAGNDFIIRIDSESQARQFVDLLKTLFQEHPGYYRQT